MGKDLFYNVHEASSIDEKKTSGNSAEQTKND